MNDYSDRRVFKCKTYGHGVVAHNCLAKKCGEFRVQVKALCVGTFVQLHFFRDEDVLFYVVNDDMQVDGIQLVTKKTDIVSVPENLWGPLFPVEKMARLPLLGDPKLAEYLGNISVGHIVEVLSLDRGVTCLGEVTFKNSIARLGVGIFFGLKILEPKENLHNLIEKFSLLKPGTKGFPRGCDIVVTIDKLRPSNVRKEMSFFNNERGNQKYIVKRLLGGQETTSGTLKSMIPLRLPNTSKKSHHSWSPDSESNLIHFSRKMTEDLLEVGEEVIILYKNTPERGVVRWVGYVGNSLKVGVEFESPIAKGVDVEGLGDLFKAKVNHTLLLPPQALIKLKDYFGKYAKDAKKNMTNNKNNNNANNNNNNNNYNTNNNNNHNNNVNNNSDYGVSEVCCKQNNEEMCRAGRKVSLSHQCLKHPERTFHSKSFQEVKDFTRNDHKAELEPQPQLHSKSFDYVKPGDKRASYSRSCSPMDGGLTQSLESRTLWTQPSLDVYESSGMLQEMSPGYYDGDKKSQKPLDDDLIFHSSYAHSNEKDSISFCQTDNWGSQYSDRSSSEENLHDFKDPQKSSCSVSYAPEDLGKGSVVELQLKGEPHYGVIRWIGTISDEKGDSPPHLIAGVEMEEESSAFTDGTFNNKRYFTCNPRKALFVPLSKCRKDSRFLEDTQRMKLPSKINYGQIDCPVIEGIIPPIATKGDVDSICGKNRGIQGHHNSCYLDATLFSMFSFTSIFDSLLYRPPTKNDIPEYAEVQRVLREEVVNPLRKNLYVRADRVMKLRTLLDKLSSVSGLTSEEKDPEEFLNCLLAQILKAEPFLKLSSGQEAFHYQLFVEKDERLVLPSVQQLFEQSFVTSDIKLKQVPSCLIIQMPRFGKSFKMYSKILPPQLLDITDIIENSPRQCTVCGQLAEFECKDCFGQQGIGNGLESISFCKRCLETAHNHQYRMNHNSRALTVPVEFSELKEHCGIPRLYLELFAVVCIETSHYVAFVKCGGGSDAPWCFFDSMADRKGEQNGYNIPEMVPCPDLPYWLSEEGAKKLNNMKDERHLPEHAKRLFSDAYMCMYQSPDLMMYR